MRSVVCLLCAASVTALTTALVRAGDEQDKYEDQATTRWAHHRAERGMRAERGERANTVRDLEAAFPGKLPKEAAKSADAEALAWFTLVAGTEDVWSKADAKMAGLSAMYERWAQRLELGPVPSIKKDEFLRFAKMIIGNSGVMEGGGGGGENLSAEADKVFRILDLNSDGELTGMELTTGLKEAKGQADTNGDGRISKEEYRAYFKNKIEAKAETLINAFKANDKLIRGLNLDQPDKKTGLPEWFAKLDTDKDGQISLFEWRQGGRPLTEFQEMDLNGDGLLTKEEYARWVKEKAAAAEEKRREEGK